MPRFTIRIELRDDQPGDYSKLHSRMLESEYSRLYYIDDEAYHMPSAEYNFESAFMTSKSVAHEVHRIAGAIRPNPRVFVTEAESRYSLGLTPLYPSSATESDFALETLG